MSDQSVESLSALMDGEVNDFEFRRTLDRVAEDPELAQKWRRYQVASSALRREDTSGAGLDISAAVMTALDEDSHKMQPVEWEAETTASSVTADQDKERYSFWKPLSSMAVAASVTAMVILGVQNFQASAPAQLADNRPDYVLPGVSASSDVMRARYGQSSLSEPQGNEPEIIRLSQGLDRYISQHQHLLGQSQPAWQTRWMPKGFSPVRHEVMPQAEVMVYSDGRYAVSVCVEDYGRQSVPEGVAQSDNMVAVGKRKGDHFVTVVGDVPMMIAERIAASVSEIN